MTRPQDLDHLIKESSPNVVWVDLTPNGPITTADTYGEWVPIAHADGTFHLEQVAGSSGADVRIEMSNTQANPDEIAVSTKLTGAGKCESIRDWFGAAFARIHVVSPGTGGSVVGSHICRRK